MRWKLSDDASLRILNEDNNITIFSLIGRKDLMADLNTDEAK